MHNYYMGVDAMMKIGIGRKNKWRGAASERSREPKLESDLAAETNSGLLGLSGSLCFVHLVLCLTYRKSGWHY